jgi:hypothetical protein
LPDRWTKCGQLNPFHNTNIFYLFTLTGSKNGQVIQIGKKLLSYKWYCTYYIILQTHASSDRQMQCSLMPAQKAYSCSGSRLQYIVEAYSYIIFNFNVTDLLLNLKMNKSFMQRKLCNILMHKIHYGNIYWPQII